MNTPVAADRRRPRVCTCCGKLHSRLVACPFCGHEHPQMEPWKLAPLAAVAEMVGGCPTQRHRVVCPQCGGSGGIRVDPAEAAIVWNQRQRKAWNRRCA